MKKLRLMVTVICLIATLSFTPVANAGGPQDTGEGPRVPRPGCAPGRPCPKLPPPPPPRLLPSGPGSYDLITDLSGYLSAMGWQLINQIALY